MDRIELQKAIELAKTVIKSKSLSTKVVAWYPHPAQVRGPFCRWFECTQVEDQYKKNVADTWDDTAFCANAMNYSPTVSEALLHLAKENEQLHAGIDDRIEACIGHLREISRLEEAVKIAVQAIENISHGDENASLQDAALDQINKLMKAKHATKI